jgi:hypothetical protein
VELSESLDELPQPASKPRASATGSTAAMRGRGMRVTGGGVEILCHGREAGQCGGFRSGNVTVRFETLTLTGKFPAW